MTHRALPPLLFLLLALAWTWPAALGEGWVGRYSDTLGTVWTIDAAPRLLAAGLNDPRTAWPTGATYLRPDSWILLGVGTLGSWIPAARLHAWLQVVGLAGSAWAAELAAVRLGARRPASILAGLGFVFGGLGSTVLLEGHVYQLLNPWLPLAVLGAARITAPGARARDGAMTALGILGSLWSTAYLGLAACVAVAGLGLGALAERQGRPRLAPMAVAALLTLPGMGLYTWIFAQGGTRWASRTDSAVQASATLESLLGPSAVVDSVYHSQVTAIPATILALFLLAPAVLGREPGWRKLGVAAATCLIASCGAWLKTDPAYPLFPLPLLALDGLPGISWLHFPFRLGWGWGLCAGIVAARAAGRLIEGQRRAPGVLGALLAADLFLYLEMPSRQRVQPDDVPSAYLQGEGPVLDLFPIDVHPTHALDLREMALACAWQVAHTRAIAEACITTSPAASPRGLLDAEVWRRALAGEPIAPLLGELGFETVAFHPDLFRPHDRMILAEALAAMDPSPAASTDGGAHVVAYRVPAVASDPTAAWARFVGEAP